MAAPTLCTAAWRLRGVGYDPGALSLADGRLAFRTLDGVVFDVPLAEVTDAHVPWYYVGGGMKLTVAGERYRLSFVAPNDAGPVPSSLLPPGVDGVPGIGEGRAAGTAWKRALGV